MAMAIDRNAFFTVPAAAALLIWPALWNGYPIVFADTGTYLSQAIRLYAGWDRPIFYSLFMLPLHARVTVWPVVAAQALLTAWILWLVCKALVPRISWIAFVGGAMALAVGTWLPWLVSELMPDVFTPLLIMVTCLLAWVPERLSWRKRAALAGLMAFMITTQLSSVPLACVALGVLGVLARYRGQAKEESVSLFSPVSASASGAGMGGPVHPGATVRKHNDAAGKWSRPLHCLLLTTPPVAAALLGLCSLNLVAHGRFAMAPFGNVFVLARVIYDGPGMAVLRRDCPWANWRLCPFLDNFPPTSDAFLWTPDSPLNRAGGAKLVSQDADAIVRAALVADPVGAARAALSNTLEQLGRFASGDGLTAWPAEVSPWIEHSFPAREAASYAAARQQAGLLSVPRLLAHIHTAVAVGGVVACLFLLPIAWIRRAPCTAFLLVVLIVLPASAAITGALSAPHDRYQSRIMWLPTFVAVVSAASLYRRIG
jgi:hypothetical protein